MYMHLCVCIYSTKQVYYYTKCVCVYLRILPLLRKKNIKTQAQNLRPHPPQNRTPILALGAEGRPGSWIIF